MAGFYCTTQPQNAAAPSPNIALPPTVFRLNDLDSKAGLAQPLFITVDPQHDTTQLMGE